MEFRLKSVAFSDLPGWAEDDPTALLEAMGRCRDHIVTQKAYRTGSLGISAEDLLPALAAAAEASLQGPAKARAFFEAWFQPFFIDTAVGASIRHRCGSAAIDWWYGTRMLYVEPGKSVRGYFFAPHEWRWADAAAEAERHPADV